MLFYQLLVLSLLFVFISNVVVDAGRYVIPGQF